MTRPTVDDLKLQRDGHLWAMESVHKRIYKPWRWTVEYDDEGMACRMWWNGTAVREWERVFGDRQWVMPEEIPEAWQKRTDSEEEV